MTLIGLSNCALHNFCNQHYVGIEQMYMIMQVDEAVSENGGKQECSVVVSLRMCRYLM